MVRCGLLAILLGACAAAALPAEQPRTIKILFLGDEGHHRPAERFRQLQPVLARRGIDLVYTDRVEALNPKTLGRYDGLLVYANIEKISPEQEKALLDFVEGGKGFIPLHCASYCFLNSPKYVALVGAQFLRHGTGTFRTVLARPDHPIMKGFAGFESWDETYVHRRHNPEGRVVLEYRVEGDQKEPWTWVRTQGKGRIFYTAWGHDERTWGNPGFQNLVERGIRWAVGADPAAAGPIAGPPAMTAHRTDVKPFEYVPAKVPFYPPGRQWGITGEPITKMQKPVDPAESVKHMVTPVGFEVKLFAGDPQIYRPICMNWDEGGRLWIAETVDYPNARQPAGKGHDRIVLCEDTDGDGRADRFTVFADKLSIPTGFTFYKGGLIVVQAPDTLYLRDTDGDGWADERKVLFSGWGTSDTHAGPSNLQWGLDGWVYGMCGYSGFNGVVGGERVRFGQGFFRFKPDGSKLEFLRSTNNNSWGVGFSEEGVLFGSTANGNPSVHLPIANRYYERVRGWSSAVLRGIAGNAPMHPITDKVRQVDYHGHFTAGAGHALYTARTYPRVYWDRTAFVAEPTGHLVATFTIEPNGASYRSRNAWNLLASDDEWTSPIMAEVGPDGHVWVIDWYNYIVQHNPTPAGFKTGRGSAYVTPLRDKTHGRIYRLVYKAAPPAPPFSLAGASPDKLVQTLRHDNFFWRRRAQRLLVERGQLDVLPALVALAGDPKVDEIGLNAGAIHALWTMQQLGALDGAHPEATAAAVAALKHKSAGVRRNAVQVLPRGEASTMAILAAGLLRDADAQVRLAALLALADQPPSRAAAEALRNLVTYEDILSEAQQQNPKGRGLRKTLQMFTIRIKEGADTLDDPWLADAVTSAAAVNAEQFLRALADTKAGNLIYGKKTTLVERVAEHYARGGPVKTVGSLLEVLAGAPEEVTAPVIAGLARGWPRDRSPALNARADEALGRLAGKLPLAARGQLIVLGERWGSKALEKYAAEVAASLLARAEDEKQSDPARVAAAVQVVEFRPRDAQTVRKVLELVTPRTSPELARGLLETLSRSEAAEVGPTLAKALPALTPAVRPAAVRVLLGRAAWTEALLDALDKGQVPLTELSLDQKAGLTSHPNRAVAERARKLLARGGGLPNPDRQKVIDELMPLTKRTGDPAAGKVVFRNHCAKCHTHSGEGAKVGPDLTGMAVHPRDHLLVEIMDPSRSVEGNYRQYVVTTRDGRVLTGLLASESKTAVELIDAEAKKQVLQRDDIDELQATTKSLMPEGFEKQLSADDLVNLLAFLTQRGKYLPLPLDKVATAVSTRGMFYSSQSPVERLVFPEWGTTTFEGVPFLLTDPRGDRVPNVILLYGPQGKLPPKMPRAVRLPCNAPVKTLHVLGGISGWGYPLGEKGSVSLTVRLHYADGKTEDHPLRNGEELADYVRRVDVPGSKFAFNLRGRQVRYLAIHPGRSEPISEIEFVKGQDATAPVIVAVTAELRQ
jgi:putative membrane-bound dehydrogenase-like protein